jgi:hypothetical protein
MSRMTKKERREMVDLVRRMRVIQQAAEVIAILLAHHRRRVVHFNVTEHPTAAWTAQQIVDAFPNESAPAYLLRDRDRVYGQRFRHRLKGMGIEEMLTAPDGRPQSPAPESAERQMRPSNGGME